MVKPTSFSDLKAAHEGYTGSFMFYALKTPLQVHYNAEQWDLCSRQSREKETISMTQPALSGVSTKLHAHLLPAGHRQKPQR